MEFNSSNQENYSMQGDFSFRYAMRMENWAKRLRQRFADTGWSKAHLSRLSGVSYDSVNKYLDGKVAQPRGDTLTKLAKALGTTEAWLRDGQTIGTTVPLISSVTAGQLAEIQDPYPKGEGEMNVLFDWQHNRCFALRVDGDSMNRVSPQGSIIIIDPLDRELIAGRRYVFALNGESTYKIYRANPPRLEPESYSIFEAIYLDGKNALVVGRVVRTFMDFA